MWQSGSRLQVGGTHQQLMVKRDQHKGGLGGGLSCMLCFAAARC
jgi:hypothetical protein